MVCYQHVVALGSSFAAGPGIEPVVDKAAGRSGRNYPHLVASRLGARLTDLTMSGATTATILDTPQRTFRGKQFAPQIVGIPSDADLITITAGGNDLGYAAGMLRTAWAGWLRSRPLTRPLASAVERGAVPSATDDETERTAARLTRVVEAVSARAPQARVVLVDYLTVLGEATCPEPTTPFRTAQITAFRHVGSQLEKAFVTAAKRSGVDLVQSSVLSVGHALGSAEPWVTGFRSSMSPLPFHPNAEGMRAIADAVYGLVTG
ncbi:SGNH/GDSL hydrolase family protein [Streptomyces hokutonensis]|uniref:SGNH/GDSL hydrolase family protein n=1 Tax=Streptomyces hokutonensis TaxID=1306990 RepID=UPI003821F430